MCNFYAGNGPQDAIFAPECLPSSRKPWSCCEAPGICCSCSPTAVGCPVIPGHPIPKALRIQSSHRGRILIRDTHCGDSPLDVLVILICRCPFCGVNFSVQSQIILHDGVPTASGFYARALTMRGLSTVGNAEVASSEDDSSSPAVEHPPRIKFKRPDKTARHIMNVSLVLLAGTI